jgi:dolichol-phosphate mannosyltransferase
MDADGSHRVVDLEKMIAAIEPGKLIVLGTRWIPGGSVVNWPKRRQYLSRAGTAYAKLALGIPLNDLTGGFRFGFIAQSPYRYPDLQWVRQPFSYL